MQSEPLLEVIDDFVPTPLFAEACKLSAARGWYYGHGSHEADWGRFWKMDLDGIEVFDAIWRDVRERCEHLAGGPLRVLRQYANGHTYGLGGRPHLDDVRPDSFTLLYYPMSEWKDEWDGETVFYDERGEIALSVRPRPNRAVLFDSRILHAGRAPSRLCPALRVTVAYKLERAAVEVPPPAAATPEGVDRKYVVRVDSAKFNQSVDEHLNQLGQTLRLPGFRPGKVPMAVLEKRYGDSARAEVMKRLSTEAIASTVPQGSILNSVDVVPDANGVEIRLAAIHPPSLPEPDFSTLTFDRLTASESDLQAAGLTIDALHANLKQQVLDHLEASYSFAVPEKLVEREFTAIWQVVQTRGSATEADKAEFRRIAERRVRLGIVVSELARRFEIAGAEVENLVMERLLSRARVAERAATPDELRDLA